MSAAHTWFGRSITMLRSRYGKILCPGAGFVVFGFGPMVPIAVGAAAAWWLNGQPLDYLVALFTLLYAASILLFLDSRCSIKNFEKDG